ncbi:hypothetical protein ACJJTC_003311 [Scirpophaga incertulas]
MNMNLGDPELELIDPTPNVYSLFIHFDKVFFWTKLASRAVVRWSKKMYSCAGVCSYEGRGGLCDIALSEPLLKLRPRKDLIETLLHEMIHAYLFVTNRDRERDGHGPNFQAHMHRINISAGLNISIYHSFHDEVEVYQTHWWRCNGPCQKMRPYFGIVRRSSNRTPGPSDYWWSRHKKTCGGSFIKIKEPEKPDRKTKIPVTKTKGDITKYLTNNNNKQITNNNTKNVSRKTMTSTINNINPSIQTNDRKTNVVVTKSLHKDSSLVQIFTDKVQTIDNKRRRNSTSVTETVRNVWVNKQLPSLNQKPIQEKTSNTNQHIINTSKVVKPSKHKATENPPNSPSSKLKKIDDYFKTTATTLLKEVYGKDFVLAESNNKMIAIKQQNQNFVDCPICSEKVDSNEINRHLDECLNKDIIETYTKDNIQLSKEPNKGLSDTKPLNNITGVLAQIPTFKNCVQNLIKSDVSKRKVTNTDMATSSPNKLIDLTNITSSMSSGRVAIKEENSIDLKRVETKPSGKFISQEHDSKVTIKVEPGSSDKKEPKLSEHKCLCCGNVINKTVAEHLDECLIFFDNNTTIPQEGASTSFANDTIVLDSDEDDVFDETMTLNATGTKSPCPCCLEMIEMNEMNKHLDSCLS